MLCLNCNRKQASRPRGLCWHCYFKEPGAREIAAPSKFEATGRAHKNEIDYYGPSPRPTQPTPALPGSEEKILVLQERALRGEALWHPEDGLKSED